MRPPLADHLTAIIQNFTPFLAFHAAHPRRLRRAAASCRAHGRQFRRHPSRAPDVAEAPPRRGAQARPRELRAHLRAPSARVFRADPTTAARVLLAASDLAAAETLLARTYSISGRVIHGRKLGRELGFATANVQLKHNRPPLTGIYAVKVHGIGAAARPAVASLGVRPTITASGRAVLEVHLFDFSGDLYAAHVRVEFLHKIRDEEKYPDLETLKTQIAPDCEAAKSFLMDHRNA